MNPLVKYLMKLAAKGEPEAMLAKELNQTVRNNILLRFSNLAEEQGGGLAQKMLAKEPFADAARYAHPEVSTKQHGAAIHKVWEKINDRPPDRFKIWSAMLQPNASQLDRWRNTVTQHGADLSGKLRELERKAGGEGPNGLSAVDRKKLDKLIRPHARAQKARLQSEDLLDWIKKKK